MASADETVIRVRELTVAFGRHVVLDKLDLDVRRGEILGFVGASGAGKSVLMRTIIGLVPKVSGRIEVLGVDLDAADDATRRGIERRWGVLFQHGALFSSLTVRQNIQFPIRENLDLSQRRSAAVKDALVARFGIDGNRLSTGGYGESAPQATNDTPEGRARNRRVELRRE